MNHAWRLLLLFSMFACHEPFSNDDLVFLKATNQDLKIEIPGDDQPMTMPADGPARFYFDARQAAEDANQGVFSVFDLVEQMSSQPPSVREENRRIYGPIPWDNHGELALVIDRVDTTTTALKTTSTSTPTFPVTQFNYLMLARPPGGTDDDFVVIFGGTSAWIDDEGFAMGTVFIDFETTKRFDPTNDGEGQIFTGFDTRFGQTTIELLFDGDGVGTFEPRVAWRYVQDNLGNGELAFFQQEDLIETTSQEELLVIVARWKNSGRGRADVLIVEGDIVIPLFASECWDEGFQRVFLASNVPDPAFAPTGMESACDADFQSEVSPE